VNSKHVGFPGERLVFTVTVQKVVIREHAFGQNAEHTMTTADGNLLWWNASGHGDWLEEGGTYTVKATVINHGKTPEGVEQTVVSHVSEFESPKRVPRVAIGLKRHSVAARTRPR
jgi:hypothetical protein